MGSLRGDRSGARLLNRTKPSLIVALLSIAAFWSAPAQATTKVCPADLNAQISAILDRPIFRRMRWGVLVQTQRVGNRQTTLAAWDGDRYFIPASNAKLLTTAAALEKLGSQFRIRTSVYQVNSLPQNVVLQVVGRGDPSLTDADLQKLAQQIRSRGVTQIDRLIGDDRFFGGDAVNPSWEWEDVQAGYGAPATSFILNQNRIGLSLVPQSIGQPLRVEWDNPGEQGWQIDNRSQTGAAGASESLQVGRDLSQNILYVRGQLAIGSDPEPVAVSIPQPTPYFLTHLQQALAAADLPVAQTSIDRVIAATPDPSTEVAAVESAPLTTLITVANQQSNNLYGEALLRLQGTNPASDALASGLASLESTLTGIGVDPATYHLVDGSGLSRHNLVSPSAIVQTLQGMSQSPNAAAYRASLSVAGVSGTLRNSFRDTPMQGRLQGKTGSMTDITSLSGYFQPPHYSPLVFSILINQAGEAIDPATGAIDEILLLLTRLQAC